jgi:hypothetical protein
MHAQPEHLWSTRVKHAPITGIPMPRCHGVPCIFLTVLLSYAAVGYLMTMASSVCTPENSQPVHGYPLLLRPRKKRPCTRYDGVSSVAELA